MGKLDIRQWFSVDASLRDWIAEQAERRGLSKAAYVRQVLLEIKNSQEDSRSD